jgi:hypothetical protein
MRRKAFDTILTAGGLVLAVVLLVAGGLLLWGHSYANNSVRDQLAEQQITFPPKAVFANPPAGSTEITPAMKQYLLKYGGEQLLTGPQAKAYADHFIAVHLSEMPYNGVFAKVSAASIAAPNNAALKAETSTVFEGTTLRGLLLEAYAFWEMGQLALIAAVCSFLLAAIMLILSGLGFAHLSRDTATDEVFVGRTATVGKPAMA